MFAMPEKKPFSGRLLFEMSVKQCKDSFLFKKSLPLQRNILLGVP